MTTSFNAKKSQHGLWFGSNSWDSSDFLFSHEVKYFFFTRRQVKLVVRFIDLWTYFGHHFIARNAARASHSKFFMDLNSNSFTEIFNGRLVFDVDIVLLQIIGYIQICLVQTHRFHFIVVFIKNSLELFGALMVFIAITFDNNQLRTQFLGNKSRHSWSDSIFSSDVVWSTKHWKRAHCHRFPL